jgi:hypothetical protein
VLTERNQTVETLRSAMLAESTISGTAMPPGLPSERATNQQPVVRP